LKLIIAKTEKRVSKNMMSIKDFQQKAYHVTCLRLAYEMQSYGTEETVNQVGNLTKLENIFKQTGFISRCVKKPPTKNRLPSVHSL